ncbi:MAG: glutamate--cysteine ligase, partial [Chromatiales bacterium]|nr:glutamate--cysteine ligase [Chromatiales bacterium]
DLDGKPHLRIEHRVMSAGPTTIDIIANSAFFIGLTHAFIEESRPVEERLEFSHARDNFYLAAKKGFEAQIHWLDGQNTGMTDLLSSLTPLARLGLEKLGCSHDDIDDYISIIEGRIAKRQTGSAWQLNYLEAHGNDLDEMFMAYLEGQNSGNPVHEWKI